MTDQPLTNAEIEAMKQSAQEAVDEPVYDHYLDAQDQAENVLRLIAELERVKLEANARAYDAEIHHAQELADQQIKCNQMLYDKDVRYAWLNVDMRELRAKLKDVPSLGQDLP